MIDLANLFAFVRRTVPLAGIFAACLCTAWAQPDGPGGPPPDGGPPGMMQQDPSRGPSIERELKQLTHLLALTADQQTQVKTILTDQHQQIDALFKSSAQNAQKTSDTASAEDEQGARHEAMEEMHTAMKGIHDAAQAKIATLLTDDQKAKFAAWEAKREKAEARQQQENDEMPPPPPDGGGPGGPGGGGPPGI